MSLKKLIDLDLLDRFLDKVKALIPSVATNAPQMDGTAAVGSSIKYAKEDHVHPTDTSLVSLDRTGTELVNGTNLNTITSPGNYYFTGVGTITNAPINTAFKMEVIRIVSGDYNNVCQIIFSFNGTATNIQNIYYRYYASNLGPTKWSNWQSVSNAFTVNNHTVLSDVPIDAYFKNILARTSRESISAGTDLNDIKTVGIYRSTSSVINSPLSDSTYDFTMFVVEGYSYAHGCFQIIFPADGDTNSIYTSDVYFRRYSPYATDPGWSDWVNIRNPELVNSHTVESDVPANAVFTDTTYESKAAASGGTDESLVTTGEKAAWNDKYSKPSGGIPDSDIASAATWNAKGTYSKPSGGIPDSDIASAATWNAKGTYSKPSGGIPDSDIASAATWNAHAVTNKGSAFASGLYKITTNSEGHVTGATAVAKSDITALGIPESDTTYTPASAAPGNVASSSSTGTSTNYARQDHTHGIDLATGDSDGQVKIAGQNVSVKGLKNLAFEDSISELAVNEIEANTDLNTLLTPGLYKCGTIAIGNTLTNAPAQTGFAMRVVSTTTNYNGRCQIVVTYLSGKIYHRVHYNGVWTEWQEWMFTNAANVANSLYYGECNTGASTAAKVVTLTNGDDFTLVEGAKICVRFENANSASNPTLNVNGTGAIAAVRFGTTVIGTTAGSAGAWSAGSIAIFVYDGTSWVEHYWHNTTYSSMSVSEYTAGTGTTARLMTAARLKAAIEMHSAPDVYTATIPTTGWTTESYGAYIDVTFTGATFAADDTVFVDLNLSDDTNLQLINDSWACLLRATPTASSAVIRFKFREIPTVAIPVRAVVT